MLVDLAHRVEQAAGRVENDHDGVVVALVRAVDLVGQVVLRDRVDVVVENDCEDTRRIRRLGGAASKQDRCEQGRCGEERPQGQFQPGQQGLFSRLKDAFTTK